MKKLIIFSVAILAMIAIKIPHSFAATIFDNTTLIGHADSFDFNPSNAGFYAGQINSISVPTIYSGTTLYIAFYSGTYWDSVCQSHINLAVGGGGWGGLSPVFSVSSASPNTLQTGSFVSIGDIALGNDIVINAAVGTSYGCHIKGVAGSDVNLSGVPAHTQAWIYIGTTPYSGGVTSTATVQLTNPLDSSSTKDFQKWTMYVTGLSTSTIDSNSSYELGVWYTQNSSTLINLKPNYGLLNANGQNVIEDNGGLIGLDDNSGNLNCHAGVGGLNVVNCYLFDVNATTTDSFWYGLIKGTRLTLQGQWYAIPYIAVEPIIDQNSTTIKFGEFQIVATGNMISFNISPSSSLPAVTTSTNLGAGVSNTNTSTAVLSHGFGSGVQIPISTPATASSTFATCAYSNATSSNLGGTFSVWNGTDWQCLFYNTISALQQSAYDSGQTYLEQTISFVSGVFPISLVADFNNDIVTAKNNLNNTTIQSVTLGNGNSNIWGGRYYTFFSSSTITWWQDKLGFDMRGFLTNIIYAGCGLVMLSTLIGVIAKIRNSNNTNA
jgi:hypothetical protein